MSTNAKLLRSKQMEQKIKLVSLIRNSILLSADFKIELIQKIELFDDKKIAELTRFFELEKEYVALDREGIEAKISDILASITK